MAKAKVKAATVAQSSPGVDSAPGNDVDNNPDSLDNKDNVKEVKEKHSAELHKAMKPYVEAYKDHKDFLVSSDGQVFLMSHEQDAKVHQKSLDPKKEIVKYSSK